MQQSDTELHMLLEFLPDGRGNSPGDLILRAAYNLKPPTEQTTININVDFRQVIPIVRRILFSISGLENWCKTDPQDSIRGIAWYSWTIYNQVLEGSWESVPTLYQQLASVREPVQLGERCAPSMTELLMELQMNVITAMQFDLMQFLNAAMSAVPTNLRKELGVAGEFGDIVAYAATGEMTCPLESPWKEIADQLRSWDSFRELATGLRTADFVSFVRNLQVVDNEERIWAEIRSEFAKVEDARLQNRETKTKSLTRSNGELKSWTQLDLDNAIREYKAERASTYNDLLEGVKRGDPSAAKRASKIFGRNQVARALGVRSRAMVTKSPPWQQIAAELRLSKKNGRATVHRIGMTVALEQAAVAGGESEVENVIRRETINLVEQSMPQQEAEATIEKLHRGEMTDNQVREMVMAYVDQRRDDRTNKIRQKL
jgi:hypothetical protein